MGTLHPADRISRLPKQFFARLTAEAARYMEQGFDVINLGQGNPDLPTPSHIVEALQQAAEDPATHCYPPFRGLPELKRAAAKWYADHYGVDLDPEREVAILPGGKTGLVEISPALLNPGDVCLVPDPGYPDYLSGITWAGAEMVPMPLRAERRFLPDFAEIPSDVADRAKLMFLNYPNNPTGAAADLAFFETAVRFAQRHEIVVFQDFAYGAIGFDGKVPPSFLQVPGAKDVGIELYSFSKTFNMAGWRLAFAVGRADVIQLLELVHDHFYCSVFSAVQRAGIAALTGPLEPVETMRRTYENRRNAFCGELRRLGYPVQPPEGSFFCWLPVPPGETSEGFAERVLETFHVVVAPGVGFGPHGEGYVRVGLLAPEERLVEAARRLAMAYHNERPKI
ncbi:pyridoxal phosphate-dependent aminotransferase [Kyrpidia sp.]|uniref:pyridoxal phosphate-dependent aminotransferase n=1 Tax=Kyrpidia sp. TaxID=2073077 RepID=UPI0025864C9D|nr:pyridoxal phosphate-dependent aminotransferase [Kyrpidia sp.]MCL6576765.1 pyridoxal phosphate-dependent aminotransferase [Kyrpidia sp.]